MASRTRAAQRSNGRRHLRTLPDRASRAIGPVEAETAPAPDTADAEGLARRLPAQLRPDARRTIARPFLPGTPTHLAGLVSRVAALPETVAAAETDRIVASFQSRYGDLRAGFADAAALVAPAGSADGTVLLPAQRMLLGAYVTAGYAVEAAALCNPSAVAHPDQSGLAPGQSRVAVSLRGIGEGHVSSIGFATATIGPGATWSFDSRPLPAIAGTTTSPASVTADAAAGDPVHRVVDAPPGLPSAAWQVEFPVATALGQRILFPATPSESHGLEDARFVRFTADDGTVEYRATYTAHDGKQISPRLLTSPDLRTFTAHRLTGPAAANKGMALFPRTIGGKHLALCRTDGESISLSSSRDGLEWDQPRPVQLPERLWELLLIGNCGSPLETDRGWLVLTHGVGPMRTYSIGAILLDLDDPSILLGRLDQPLLQANPFERDGYVPEVLYTCGALMRDGLLWLPYGIGDGRIGVAWAAVDRVLDAMTCR